MPRLSAALDPFTAVAEPGRRLMLGMLAGGERPVNDMVGVLGWSQPQVSKHLRVLLRAGLVDVRKAGRHRIYKLNADRLKPVHDWVSMFERFWDEQLIRIKHRAEEKVKLPPADNRGGQKSKE